MTKKLSGRALARFEAERDVWQEVLEGARAIKAGKGKKSKAEPRSPIVRARLKSGLTQGQFAALLGVSRRTLEQWEQGKIGDCHKPARNFLGVNTASRAQLTVPDFSPPDTGAVEHRRREPSGAAKTLIRVAERHPEVLREMARERGC